MTLAHAIVTAPSAEGVLPARFMLFLHGILGSGANWRTFAKGIAAAEPSWGAVLVDLRLHGQSQTGFSPPHTIAAAAADVAALVDSLEAGWARTAEAPSVRGVLAHSFGGKVALELARERGTSLEQLFVIDSTPSARPDAKGSESTQHIVDLLTQLPAEFPDRAAFMEWVEARGVSRPIAMWLAMNVRPIPKTSRVAFASDIEGIRRLLADYFARDLWEVLERAPETLQAHMIVGGASTVVSEDDRAHVNECPTTTLDVIERAGHWVHVDAPDALAGIVLSYLRKNPR